jgi:uncharacterized membrane protein
VIPRPSFRLPIWGALSVITAAYLVRSLVLRGGDFTPDMPSDAIAAVALLVGVCGVAWVRFTMRDEDSSSSESDD